MSTLVTGSAVALKEEVLRNIAHPSMVQKTTLDFLEEAHKGNIDLVDCTNPAIFIMESSAVQAAACMEHNEITLSKMYPSLATTYADLYLHMSDKDYDRRFALPSTNTLTMIMVYESFFNNAVDDPSGIFKSVTLPRDTEINVGGYIHTLDYAISIQLYQNNSLKVIVDREGDVTGPDVQSTVIRSTVISDAAEIPFIIFDLDVRQIRKSATTFDVANSVHFMQRVVFEDSYHLTKVYRMVLGKWVKVHITHSPHVFDPYEPTVILSVEDQTVKIDIPPIYTLNGSMGNELLVIVYTTRGEIDYNPTDLNPDANVITLRNLTDDFNDRNVALTRTSYRVRATHKLRGGRVGLSFQELRDRMLSNTVGVNNTPITPNHFGVVADDYGYSSVLYNDDLTGRQWVLTSKLPSPVNLPFITDAAMSYVTLQTSMAKLKDNASVHDNGNQITINSDMLYELDGNDHILHSKNYTNGLRTETNADLTVMMNKIDTRYSPFYYVVEYIGGAVSTRAFHLDEPELSHVNFYSRNNSLPILINTAGVNIELKLGYFEIKLACAVNPELIALADTAFFAQMSWVTSKEGDLVHIPAYSIHKNVNGAFISTFRVETNLRIDDNELVVTNALTNLDVTEHEAPIQFDSQIDFIFGTRIPDANYVPSNMDELTYKANAGEHLYPLTRERISTLFGAELTHLWRNSRVLDNTVVYERYIDDVPMRYTSTEVIIDANRPVPFSVNEDCEVEFHKATTLNEIVKDDNGQVIYIHRAGDYVIGPNNRPVATGLNEHEFVMDIMVFDGIFYFAQNELIIKHLNDLKYTILSKSTKELQPIINRSLEHTDIVYKPRDSMGLARINPIEGELSVVEKKQKLSIIIYVERTILSSEASKDLIKATTVLTVSKVLERTTVSHSEMIIALSEAYGEGVLGVSVNGLGGLTDQQVTMTLTDLGDKLYIAKKAVVDNQDRFSVTEDIDIKFVDYTVS